MKRLAGGCLVLVIGIGAVWILFRVAPTGALLALWGGGGIWLWYVVSRPLPPASNPSPPPPDPLPENTKPQFTVLDDPDNPARHRVVWTTETETDS